MSSRFAIVNPCSKNWADLYGDGLRRRCDDCRKDVHAIEQYSQEAWDQIWHESHGRVCGFLGGESPAEPRSRRAVLVGTLLTAISPLMAQTGRVRIRVVDATGAVITTAQASLLRVDGKPTRTEQANDSGEIVWADLPMGDCRFTVAAPGFKTKPVVVTLHNGDEMRIDAALEVGIVGEVITVETASTKPHSTMAVSAAGPKTTRAKRRRWLIFR